MEDLLQELGCSAAGLLGAALCYGDEHGDWGMFFCLSD